MQNKSEENTRLASLVWQIADEMRSSTALQASGAMIPLAAYVALLMQDGGDGDALGDIQARANEEAEVRDFLLRSFDEKWMEAARRLSREATKEALREFVLYYDFLAGAGKVAGEHATPDCICRLALAILGIKQGENVADLGCGYGNFLVAAAGAHPNDTYYGVEISDAAACLAQIRMNLMGVDSAIEIGDMLSRKPKRQFDKVFSQYPFGMRLQHVGGSGGYYDEFKKGNTGFGRSSSADWVFNKLLCDSLSPDGEAVAIMTNGATFNGGDELARKYFLDNGMIRAVVALPGGLLRGTLVPITLVVFGRNDGPVRIVDASDLFVPGRRWNTIGDDEIEEIVRRLSESGESSRLVTREELAATEYCLFPSRYFGREINMVNPTRIGELAESIERGVALVASELDMISTDEDTGISYLRLSDIEDGRIAGGLPHIRALDTKLEKLRLKNGDLIVSKSGAPFKVAVAEVPEGQTILASGNIYIIRLNTERVNPYYVAAFLASEDGKEIMGRMVVGTAIPSLPIKNLRAMEIPVPSMEEQEAIADAYRARLDEVEVLKIKLEKARNNAVSTYDEVMGR
uniref:site-specific DNA-methyltransferase (adenine-specific) n=1 Tax=Muribaculaceae bacterium Z82 TaxID=2304548 RepID=A0A7C9P5N3_9BACT